MLAPENLASPHALTSAQPVRATLHRFERHDDVAGQKLAHHTKKRSASRRRPDLADVRMHRAVLWVNAARAVMRRSSLSSATNAAAATARGAARRHNVDVFGVGAARVSGGAYLGQRGRGQVAAVRSGLDVPADPTVGFHFRPDIGPETSQVRESARTPAERKS